MEAAVKLIVKHFPNTPVYPAMGNHESAPVNRFVMHDRDTFIVSSFVVLELET